MNRLGNPSIHPPLLKLRRTLPAVAVGYGGHSREITSGNTSFGARCCGLSACFVREAAVEHFVSKILFLRDLPPCLGVALGRRRECLLNSAKHVLKEVYRRVSPLKNYIKMTLLFSGILAMTLQAQEPMKHDAKIYVAGHNGLVGSAIMRRLSKEGFTNIITRTSTALDLRDQQAVNSFFAQECPEYVFLAAAKVGGILANSQYKADFIYDNLMINTNVIHAAYKCGAKKLLFLGSSCIYPLDCPQPIKEEYLLSSELEPTNDAYAIAKIAGIKMCQSYNEQHGTRFIAFMPTNLYGPYDNFNLQKSHVLPALLAKFYIAKQQGQDSVAIWGTGSPYREFLYVDDLADALLFLMQHHEGNDIVNVGTGEDISIKELAGVIKEIVGFEGEIIFDRTKPDGTPRKLLNVDRLKKIGWQATTSLKDGIEKTLTWCKENKVFTHKE